MSPEQLETVFDRLDRDSNGFLTPVEFSAGLDEFLGKDMTELSQMNMDEDVDELDVSHDPTAVTFVNTLMELGADQLFKDQQELCSLWCELHKDSPELLSVLEGILIHAKSHLQDTIRERDSLEQALGRRESEHDKVVRSIYEETENQIREERANHLAKDSIKERLRAQQLEDELKTREEELENTLRKQKELEARMKHLTLEQANLKDQNQQLQYNNQQLQEHVENNREQLRASLNQLQVLQANADQEQAVRQKNVMRVSRNMKKEKESLLRQLEILKDMNRRLRDEKDAQQCLKRVSHRHTAPPSLPLPYYLNEELRTPWTHETVPH